MLARAISNDSRGAIILQMFSSSVMQDRIAKPSAIQRLAILRVAVQSTVIIESSEPVNERKQQHPFIHQYTAILLIGLNLMLLFACTRYFL